MGHSLHNRPSDARLGETAKNGIEDGTKSVGNALANQSGVPDLVEGIEKRKIGQVASGALSLSSIVPVGKALLGGIKAAAFGVKTASTMLGISSTSVRSAAKLRSQLVGQEIANGHAFEKHVLNQGEFGGLSIRTRTHLAEHVERVVDNPTAVKQLSNGRTAYWDDATSTVVIRNPKAADGGTAFQPTGGRAYFDGLR